MPENDDGRIDEYIDTAQAASELGVTIRRVQAMISAGQLPARKLARDWLILRSDLKVVRDRRPGRPRKEASEASREAPDVEPS